MKKAARVGNFMIVQNDEGGIVVFRTYDNIKGALREISDAIGFKYDPAWTTRQFGSKLIDALNGK